MKLKECKLYMTMIKFKCPYLWIGDWRQPFLFQFFDTFFVLSKIYFSSH